MLNYGPLSQYVCNACGAVLKETNLDVEIATVIEDCPNCGASLANTLKRQSKLEPKLAAPKLQTAYDLTRFRLDIENLGDLVHLSTSGSLCITGQHANLLLTRLLVRTLLPANHGGLDSPFVIVVDAGNKSDFYQTVNFIRQYGLDVQNTLDRIIVSRTFTVHQLKSLLQRELPKIVKQYQARAVIIPGLLDLFDDPSVKKKEAKRVIERIMRLITDISSRLLVLTSVSNGDYVSLALPNFKQRIMINAAKRGVLTANVHNGEKIVATKLTERELKTIGK